MQVKNLWTVYLFNLIQILVVEILYIIINSYILVHTSCEVKNCPPTLIWYHVSATFVAVNSIFQFVYCFIFFTSIAFNCDHQNSDTSTIKYKSEISIIFYLCLDLTFKILNGLCVYMIFYNGFPKENVEKDIPFNNLQMNNLIVFLVLVHILKFLYYGIMSIIMKCSSN